MITIIPASELRSGDVFSTDGVWLRQVFDDEADFIGIHLICHGVEKFAYLTPDAPCPIWRP